MTDKREATAYHILLPYSSREGDGVAANARLEEVKRKIVDLESFSAFAKELSTCPSAKNGGLLGTFPRGKMVSKFDDAVFSGKLGEPIGPINTLYGAHLIWVSDRTTA